MARLRRAELPAGDKSAAWGDDSKAFHRYMYLSFYALDEDSARRLRDLEDRRIFYAYGAGSTQDLDPRWHRFGGDSEHRGPLAQAEIVELDALRKLADTASPYR